MDECCQLWPYEQFSHEYAECGRCSPAREKECIIPTGFLTALRQTVVIIHFTVNCKLHVRVSPESYRSKINLVLKRKSRARTRPTLLILCTLGRYPATLRPSSPRIASRCNYSGMLVRLWVANGSSSAHPNSSSDPISSSSSGWLSEMRSLLRFREVGIGPEWWAM